MKLGVHKVSNGTKRVKIVVAVVIAVALIGGIVAITMLASAGGSLTLTVSQAKAQLADLEGKKVKVSGVLLGSTVKYEPAKPLLIFNMKDEQDDSQVKVIFRDLKPDNFIDGKKIFVEGTVQDGTIEADKVMTSCPSKYQSQ